MLTAECFLRKKPEHLPFPASHSLQEGEMAGQAILGDTVLKQASASETGTSADAIDAVGAGENAIEALVAEHAGMVFRMAYSILRHRDDAEDAVQECFLRVVKSRRRLAWVRNPKTWIARIAWTTALDRRAARDASAT